MTTLIAQVTILRNAGVGAVRSINGSGVFDAWKDLVAVAPGESFDEADAGEVARLIGAGAARAKNIEAAPGVL